MKNTSTYTCEFCGNTSTDYDEIECCERSHIPFDRLTLLPTAPELTYADIYQLDEATREQPVAKKIVTPTIQCYKPSELYPYALRVLAMNDDGSFKVLKYVLVEPSLKTPRGKEAEEISAFNAKVTTKRKERESEIAHWAEAHPLSKEVRDRIRKSYPEEQQWRAPAYYPWTTSTESIDRTFTCWSELVLDDRDGALIEDMRKLIEEWRKFKESQLG